MSEESAAEEGLAEEEGPAGNTGPAGDEVPTIDIELATERLDEWRAE